jgi:hypothetical protein
MQARYPITTQKFNGARFDDHGLDLDVLQELIAYKALLIETAKSLWRAKNPNRQRLKRNFEESVRLKFYELEPGSVAVPIEREYEVADSALPFAHQPDELDEAAGLIDEAINAGAEDRMLPPEFPKSVLPLFENLGKSIREDESIEFLPPRERGGPSALYTHVVRRRLLARLVDEYSDRVNVIGEIRRASIDGNRFAVRQDDGITIEGKFQPEQEATITEALHEHASCRVEVSGKGTFGADGVLKRIDEVDGLIVRRLDEMLYDPSARPIWEIIEELGKSIPDTEWEKLPLDASVNLDRYLYDDQETQP